VARWRVEYSLHHGADMTYARLALLALIACHDADGKSEHAPEPAAAPSTVAAAPTKPPSTDDYVPAEFKVGMDRWKDSGVYLDGRPIAFLRFGELPIALQPTWVKDKVSDNKPPGCPIEKCPGWKWSEQRFYKFTDYLRALGVDPKQVKMLHVYGPKLSQTIAATGRDLESKAADEFLFRFGALVGGKPIPHVPLHFGNGKQPDKINGVMIYVDKKPPTITRDGIELDGLPATGVPYYGEPLRGGVRIYLDDRYLTMIKRSELEAKQATTTADGELHWKLAAIVAATGVDTSKVVEGWVIRAERRAERIPWSDLQQMTFSAGSKAHGGVLLGDKEILANAIALHTRAIRPEELPEIRQDEEP
jgi:hypothetical protein